MELSFSWAFGLTRLKVRSWPYHRLLAPAIHWLVRGCYRLILGKGDRNPATDLRLSLQWASGYTIPRGDRDLNTNVLPRTESGGHLTKKFDTCGLFLAGWLQIGNFFLYLLLGSLPKILLGQSKSDLVSEGTSVGNQWDHLFAHKQGSPRNN